MAHAGKDGAEAVAEMDWFPKPGCVVEAGCVNFETHAARRERRDDGGEGCRGDVEVVSWIVWRDIEREGG